MILESLTGCAVLLDEKTSSFESPGNTEHNEDGSIVNWTSYNYNHVLHYVSHVSTQRFVLSKGADSTNRNPRL